MSWRHVPLSRSLGEFSALWDALNTRYYNGHPFNDSRFVEPLLRYFGTDQERLFIHDNESTIDGLLILAPAKPGVWQLFMPAQLQAAPLLISHAGLIDELFSAMPLSVQLLELLNQDPDFSPPGLFDKAANRLFSPNAVTMDVAPDGDFDVYWAARSSNLIKNIRRYENRVTKEFETGRFQIVINPDDMHEAVARYGTLESAGWKGERGTSIHPQNDQGKFYLEVLHQFALTGQAQVLEYWLGERLAASRLIVSSAGMHIILKTTYDEALSQVAPGRLLLKQYLQHVFASKDQGKVEFYTNASQDQLAWATGQRVINHISVFRFAWQTRLYTRYQQLTHNPKQDSSSLTNSQVEAQADLAHVSKAAQALINTQESSSFDLGTDWFHLLETCALTEAEIPRYYVSTRNNTERCVLPLLLRGKQITGLTTCYTSLYRPALAPDIQVEELAAVFRRIIADTHPDSIRLDAMAPEHPSFALLQDAMRQSGLSVHSYFAFGNWYLPVNKRSFEDYLAGLSSKTRNTFKRKEKKFLASGIGQIEIITQQDSLESAISAWGQIYTSSWKKPEPFTNLMPSLLRLCAKRGWLRMGVAYYNQKPIAAQIWIVNGGRAAIYKLAYDEKHAQHSAGTILTAHLMRHVLDVDKVAEVDYLIGDDEYKRDWLSHRRERRGIVGYNPRALRGLVGLTIQQLGALRRKHIKGEPTLKWTIYPGCEAERFAQQWDDLNERGVKSPLLTSRFLLAALRTFGSGREKLACLGSIESPDCLAVIYERKRGVWETFQPSQAPLGFWLMRPGIDLSDVLPSLISALPGVPLLLGLTQQDPLLLTRSHDSSKIRTLDYIETARIVLEGGFDAYWEQRGKNLRQNMRKARNKLEKAEIAVRLECITDPTAVKEAVSNYGRLESGGWKASNGTAINLDNDQGHFYKNLLETHCQAGHGRIYQLMFNDTIAAMDLCVDLGGVIVILKTTYDEAMADYSPAMLMHQELIQALFNAGELKQIEFYGKVMDWHTRLTEDKRTLYHLNHYRWGWLKRPLPKSQQLAT